MFLRLFESFGWGLLAVLVVQIATSVEAVAVMRALDTQLISMFASIQDSIEDATGIRAANNE